jgi:hypothetical protein
MRKLHLLRDDAWDDKAPNKLIQKALNAEVDSKRIIFIGAKSNAPEDNNPDTARSIIFDATSGAG